MRRGGGPRTPASRRWSTIPQSSGIVSSLNDDITHATDVLIIGKRVLPRNRQRYSRTSVVTHSEGKGPVREGIVAYSLCEPTSYFLWWSTDSVHRQSAEPPCYASETWYPQWYCSNHRRVPTGADPGQIALNEWCLVDTVQTAVEVRSCLGPCGVEIPQVQFLDKFDTPICVQRRMPASLPEFVQFSPRWSMSLLCCAMGFCRGSSSTGTTSPFSRAGYDVPVIMQRRYVTASMTFSV